MGNQQSQSLTGLRKISSFSELLSIIRVINEKVSRLKWDFQPIIFRSRPELQNQIQFPLFWRNEVRVEATQQEKILRTMSIHTFTTIAAEILSLIPDSAKPQEEGNGSGSGNENECPICMDAKPDVVLGCGHRFCEKCMMEWKEHETCPLCRASSDCTTELWVLAGSPTDTELTKHIQNLVKNTL